MTPDAAHDLAELALIAAARPTRIDPVTALRVARDRSGLSVEDFARALGIFTGFYILMATGRRPVPPWVMGRVQRFGWTHGPSDEAA